MIVPNYWAEASKQHKSSGKQITVRRYGWSDVSESEALSNAEARVDEALQRILTGEKLNKREPKVAYNGADGVPIREEVLARYSEQVITRNAYGAHCLNSPNALFADIDFLSKRTVKSSLLAFSTLAFTSVICGYLLQNWGATFGLLLVSLIFSAPFANFMTRFSVAVQGGAERIAERRLINFIARNPSWNVRIYRTPAGYRLLATHQPFETSSDEVNKFFTAVSADPIYVRMCSNQRCFRARLTAKPWRIGISTHMRPRPGVWPVRPEHIAIRNEWIAKYEAAAISFAACKYIESLGSGIVHDAIKPVVELHDLESRALLINTQIA
jgi:hypothetical protein